MPTECWRTEAAICWAERGRLLDDFGQLVDGAAGLVDQPAPASTPLVPCSVAMTAALVARWMSDRMRADLGGGGLGLLGQVADLLGDDREALAVLAGAAGLDGGVQGQQVGLVGEVVDGGDDLADLLGLLGQGQDVLGDRLAPAARMSAMPARRRPTAATPSPATRWAPRAVSATAMAIWTAWSAEALTWSTVAVVWAIAADCSVAPADCCRRRRQDLAARRGQALRPGLQLVVQRPAARRSSSRNGVGHLAELVARPHGDVLVEVALGEPGRRPRPGRPRGRWGG